MVSLPEMPKQGMANVLILQGFSNEEPSKLTIQVRLVLQHLWSQKYIRHPRGSGFLFGHFDLETHWILGCRYCNSIKSPLPPLEDLWLTLYWCCIDILKMCIWLSTPGQVAADTVTLRCHCNTRKVVFQLHVLSSPPLPSPLSPLLSPLSSSPHK